MNRLTHRRSAPVALGLSLLVAIVALPALASPVAAGWRDYTANCDVNLRASASTSAAVLKVIPAGTTVTTSSEVSGDSWSADCNGTVAGKRWYAIVRIGNTDVSTLFGVTQVYAAAGLFRATGTLAGIDVSRWQGPIDYTKVKAAGMSFVVAKATEGIGYLDSAWTTNRSQAQSAGLAVTGYHFARPDLNPTDPVGEADWFVSQLGLSPGMLVPALDIERAGSMTVAARQAWVEAWLAEVYAKTGARPMIYTSPAFWKTYLGDTRQFADEGYTVLWIAHWFVNSPTTPASNWGGKGWTFWQYDDCGTVPGIGGCVDMDLFNGLDLTRVTFGADFKVAAGPASQSVEQGGSGGLSVSIDRDYFTLPISLTVSGLPSGVTATTTLAPVSGGSTSYSFSVGSTTPVGTYPVTVSGTANGLTRTATTSLVVTDGKPPTVVAPFPRLYAGSVIGSTTPVRSSWSATDASGIAGYALQHQVDGGAWSSVSLTGPLATSAVESLSFGHTQRDQVQATDGVGNASAWTAGPRITPQLTQQWSTAVRYTSGWRTVSATYASGGSLKYATSKGVYATYTFSGSAISWITYRGPNRGKAAVYIDGSYKGTIDLYATKYLARQVAYAYNWTANGTHTIRIVCLGTAGRPRVDIDAFVRLVR